MARYAHRKLACSMSIVRSSRWIAGEAIVPLLPSTTGVSTGWTAIFTPRVGRTFAWLECLDDAEKSAAAMKYSRGQACRPRPFVGIHALALVLQWNGCCAEIDGGTVMDTNTEPHVPDATADDAGAAARLHEPHAV